MQGQPPASDDDRLRGGEKMEETLDFLEELIDEYTKQHIGFSKDRLGAVPKEGKEKEWEESQRKVDKLFLIAKIIHSESINMEIRKKSGSYSISEIAQKLLNESANTCIFEGTDSSEVFVVDAIHRKTIAKFRVKISNHCLMIMEYQFF